MKARVPRRKDKNDTGGASTSRSRKRDREEKQRSEETASAKRRKTHLSHQIYVSENGELLHRSNTRKETRTDSTVQKGQTGDPQEADVPDSAESLLAPFEDAQPPPPNPIPDDSSNDTDTASKIPELDGPLQSWVDDFRQSFLEEFVRLEGRCGHYSCDGVHDEEEEGLYRCIDCSGPHIYCASCIVDRHKWLPLHRIQAWEDGYFQHSSLASLGLVVQLGHCGGRCPLPSAIRQDFCVVDTSGHHNVNVQFCRCSLVEEYTQLLRFRWYPASTTRPRTAFTFDYITTFHLLTLQGKLSAYDYCLSIERKTDDTGTLNVQSRYEQFLICMRQFRHLISLMRSVKALGPQGVDALCEGDCAVECPACPHPLINLPPDWEKAPPEVRWKYTLNLTIDANFRLKNRSRQTQNDASLCDGLGHWVPIGPYMTHVEAHAADTEPNLCDSELKAVDHAQSKLAKGYSATGVVATVCARHSLVRRNGLGNLQKGERYANTDFVVLYSLKNQQFARLSLLYDIACQWSRHFPRRVKEFPDDMKLSNEQIKNTVFVIPKFHLYAHGPSCQASFSLSYLPWSAETDGEDPERWWAHVNPISMSTKIMSAGSRADTIDDHAAAWNWRKIVSMGDYQLERLRLALHMKARHVALHSQFSAEFGAADLEKWLRSLQAWERNRSKPNPFRENDTGVTMASVRLELAKEDAPTLVDQSPHGSNEFLYKGLELEENQRLLRLNLTDKTINQATDLQVKRNALTRLICQWRTEQAVHMPSVEIDATLPSSTPESLPLRLPSSLPPSPSLQLLRDKEHRLRTAQVHDSLREIRRLLRITAGLAQFKYTQVGYSQGANTRARSQIKRFKDKTSIVVARYRAARAALLLLDPQGSWVAQFHDLKDSDIQWPTRDPNDASNAQENTREISWIWRSSLPLAPGPSNVEIGNALRIEWLKSYARQQRWSEELSLVLEEMRRISAFFEWKAANIVQTIQTCFRNVDDSDELNEGLGAYGYHQAAVYCALRRKFLSLWEPVLQAHNLSMDSD